MSSVELVSCHWAVRPHPRLLGRARSAVLAFLHNRAVDPECRERVVIACDELLRNAVDHVGDRMVLSVCVRPEDVRIAVTDRRRTDAHALWKGMTAASGLTLVWQLSRELYVMPVGQGKSVAAEIARREPPVDDRPARPVPELP